MSNRKYSGDFILGCALVGVGAVFALTTLALHVYCTLTGRCH